MPKCNMLIQSVGKSDVGRVRQKNEDSFFTDNTWGLFVVADGMGGHVGGQMASSLAVESIRDIIAQRIDDIRQIAEQDAQHHQHMLDTLANAVRFACLTIYDCSQANPELRGMGTTVTALLVHNWHAFIAHVGDSRCYLYRAADILQVTDDHSLVNEQIKAGMITREQARVSHLKNIITRSVGFERDVAVDTFLLPILPGDNFLLCSDGLTNFVREEEIGTMLSDMSYTQAPDALIALANERGGDDNITVVCVQADKADLAGGLEDT